MNLGPAEILVVLIVALVVFGPKRLPEVGRQVGAAMRELRKMQESVKAEIDTVIHPDLSPHVDSHPAVEEQDHSALPAPSAEPLPDDAGDDPFRGPQGSFS